ncbi:Probable glutathione peroxidase 8, variant 2 [Ancistrocladus abbreviatus]
MASQPNENPLSIYDITVKDAQGSDVNLGAYRGKVLLIVNVASKCGMTNSNYTELNQLYRNYKDQGLEILAFPCNQFGEEEPGSNDQILDFVCTRFKSDFPIFDKIDVNGANASPLYELLKLGKWGIFGDDIQWNFAKFLVGRDGQVVGRYYPTTSLLSLELLRLGKERTDPAYLKKCSNLVVSLQAWVIPLRWY